jgi:hypothetical protein
MSLSSTTLLVLQKVGAAAFAADAKLKAEVKDYSQRVHEAMVANPDGQKNDALFANWKIVSRLSQAISSIEEELKKLFATAAALGAEAPAAAPVAKVAKNTKPAAPKRNVKKVGKSAAKAQPVALVAVTETVSVTPAPAKAAKTKPASKAGPKAAPKVAPKAAPEVAAKAPASAKVKAFAKPKAKAKTVAKKLSSKTAGPATLGANPTKVLRHLETLLNANDFSVISQTAVSKETGIPLGSMTAATKKLMETGYLLAGPSGSFKLAKAPTAAL